MELASQLGVRPTSFDAQVKTLLYGREQSPMNTFVIRKGGLFEKRKGSSKAHPLAALGRRASPHPKEIIIECEIYTSINYLFRIPIKKNKCPSWKDEA